MGIFHFHKKNQIKTKFIRERNLITAGGRPTGALVIINLSIFAPQVLGQNVRCNKLHLTGKNEKGITAKNNLNHKFNFFPCFLYYES